MKPTLLGATFLFSLACGGVDQATLDGAPPEQAERQVLAAFEVDGVEVQFVQVSAPDGSQLLSLEEQAPLGIASSPVAELAARESTALEAFFALAPPGMQPPEELIAAHPAQARAFEREDESELVEWSFEPSALAEKSIASCESWVFAEDATFQVLNRKSKNNLSTSNSIYTDLTTRNVTVGACNDGSRAIETARAWEDANQDVFVLEPFTTLNAATHRRWYNWNRLGPSVCEGLVCAPEPLRYGVWVSAGGARTLYHLKAGEMFRRVPSPR